MANSFQIDIITPVENINIGTSEYLRAPNLDGLLLRQETDYYSYYYYYLQ